MLIDSEFSAPRNDLAQLCSGQRVIADEIEAVRAERKRHIVLLQPLFQRVDLIPRIELSRGSRSPYCSLLEVGRFFWALHYQTSE